VGDRLGGCCLVLVVVQIFLGTQTRELVDYALEHGVLMRAEVVD
jgi:hypothetical protein